MLARESEAAGRVLALAQRGRREMEVQLGAVSQALVFLKARLEEPVGLSARLALAPGSSALAETVLVPFWPISGTVDGAAAVLAAAQQQQQ